MTNEKLNQIIAESIEKVLNESRPVQTVDDFFTVLENDPSKNTFAYCYYASAPTMNKSFIDDDGVKKPNPLIGKLIKNTVYKFQYGKTYKEAIAKKNPNWEIQQRKGEFGKLDGFSVIETDKNGNLQLPLADPQTVYTSYVLFDENGTRIVDKSEIAKYLPQNRAFSAPSSGVAFRNLKVDKIYRLSCGGMQWENPHFEYNEIKNLLK